jgi:competence protein ComEA
MAENTKSFILKAKLLILSLISKPAPLIFLGIIIVIIGLLFGNKINFSSAKVEVLQTPDTGATADVKIVKNQIVIDISGEVEKPGVYHLDEGSRIEDAITASGGLSINADREWVDKNLNKAAKLSDGQKIYIPNQQSKVLSATVSSDKSNVAQSYNEAATGLVNINSSSLSDLDGLPGIGQVYAQKIIDQRPYSDIHDLVSKKVIKESLFNKIKDKISIY